MWLLLIWEGHLLQGEEHLCALRTELLAILWFQSIMSK